MCEILFGTQTVADERGEKGHLPVSLPPVPPNTHTHYTHLKISQMYTHAVCRPRTKILHQSSILIFKLTVDLYNMKLFPFFVKRIEGQIKIIARDDRAY